MPELATTIELVTPVGLLSGIARFGWSVGVVTVIIAGSSVQLCASSVAAPASTTPNPYLWSTWKPPPFVAQSASSGSFCRADSARTERRSRHVSAGFAWRTSATTPEASGVAEDVPLNVFVYERSG